MSRNDSETNRVPNLLLPAPHERIVNLLDGVEEAKEVLVRLAGPLGHLPVEQLGGGGSVGRLAGRVDRDVHEAAGDEDRLLHAAHGLDEVVHQGQDAVRRVLEALVAGLARVSLHELVAANTSKMNKTEVRSFPLLWPPLIN